jgi:HECT-domain (ubiquitin-transferase)
VDVVQHVQISHNADAESVNRTMVCKVPVPTCTYRLTALSAAHTYDVLAKEFNESGMALSCGDTDTCVSSAVPGVQDELKGIEAQSTEPNAAGDCSESVATTSSNASIQTYLIPDNSAGAGAGRVEGEGGVCLTCFESIPTAAAQCSACALDERFELAGGWVLPASPVPALAPTADASTNVGSVNGAAERSVEETTSYPSLPVEGDTEQSLDARSTAQEEKEGEDGAHSTATGDDSVWGTAAEHPLPPFPPLCVDVDADTDADVARPSLDSISTTDSNTVLNVNALLPADVDDTPREIDDDKCGEEGKAAVAVEDPDDVITFTARGDFTYVGRFKTRLEGSLLSAGNLKDPSVGCGMLLPSDMQRRLSKWSEEADCALLEFINLESSDGTSNLFTYPGLTALSKQFLTFRAACMSNMDLLDVQTRILQFEALNKSLEELIPIVNILNTDPLSLGARIRRCNRYIFMSVKQPLLDRIVAATVTACGGDMPAQLALDNMKSMASREKTSSDNPSDINCFVQAFRQLQSKDSAVFRHVFNTDRVFQISFVGESGIDAGGVFREGVSRIIEDLFSEHFNLLLLCPNGKHEVHSNMEKFVPNPQMTDPTSILMFEFIGRLMSMSQRVKLCLPFEFPSLIWKRLAGEEIAFEDLMGVDAISCRHLAEIKSCDSHGIVDESSFSVKFGGKLRFVFQRCDGVEEELEPGSRDRVVRFHNRLEYCKLVERAKAKEFDLQVSAIERGMAEVSPMRILKLFSWQQLEVLVAGSPLFDFELWKQKTEASGLTSKTLDLFWKVMASFSSKEQSGFIRFAWGRSRLPPPKDFTTKMKLIFGQGKLPVAHTCFFSIELPEYATEAEMRTGLLTAINFGVGGILMG